MTAFHLSTFLLGQATKNLCCLVAAVHRDPALAPADAAEDESETDDNSDSDAGEARPRKVVAAVRDLGPEPGAEPAPADTDVDLAPPPLPDDDDEAAPAAALEEDEEEQDEEKEAGEASADGAAQDAENVPSRKRSKAPAGDMESRSQRSKRPTAAAAVDAANSADAADVEPAAEAGSSEAAAAVAAASGGDALADAVAEIVVPHRAINWVFTRLSHVARRYNGERRECVFKFFAAMSVRIICPFHDCTV
jgi:hypothetical protein